MTGPHRGQLGGAHTWSLDHYIGSDTFSVTTTNLRSGQIIKQLQTDSNSQVIPNASNGWEFYPYFWWTAVGGLFLRKTSRHSTDHLAPLSLIIHCDRNVVRMISSSPQSESQDEVLFVVLFVVLVCRHLCSDGESRHRLLTSKNIGYHRYNKSNLKWSSRCGKRWKLVKKKLIFD